MAECINYNCSPLEEHVKNDCNEERLGGIPDIIILECDHTITDPSNGVQVNANIASGKAVLLRNIKCGIDQPSPIEVARMVSKQPSYAVNYDRSATFMDANVNPHNNNTFYPSILNGRTLGGVIFRESGDPEKPMVRWVDSPVQASGGSITPNDNNEQIRFEVTLKWRSKVEPLLSPEPVGVF